MNRIKEQSEALTEQLSAWYHDLHRIPEIGLSLPETKEYVKTQLTEMGYEVQEMGASSLTTLLTGDHPGSTILLRADMDALPMEEINELPFCSIHPGAAHMCGHDSHTAMLLGAASILRRHRSDIHGSVKFMFQAGEEGYNGAREMVNCGILDDPPVDAALALHCLSGNDLPTGTMLCALGGPAKASSDTFCITVSGTGCHGATPEQGVDVINILCHIQNALQTVLSREISPFSSAVLSVCQISAGTAANIFPSEGFLRGTIRTFDEDLRQKLKDRIRCIAALTAESFGGTAVVDISDGLRPMVNDIPLAQELFSYMQNYLGEDRTGVISPIMGADDFCEISCRVPSVYMDLCTGSREEGYLYGVHNPRFLLNEAALPIGCGCFVYAALRYLSNHAQP